MSIPLIQDNQKDSINASLIAIKREEERLQALIAEADKKIAEADKKIAQLNELKVNKSDIVDEVTLNNMQSVTSNAVAESLSYSETERFTGKYFGNKKVYKCAVNGILNPQLTTIQNIQHLLNVTGYIIKSGNKFMANTYRSETTFNFIYLNGNTIYAQFPPDMQNSPCYINLEYTKTTD